MFSRLTTLRTTVAVRPSLLLLLPALVLSLAPHPAQAVDVGNLMFAAPGVGDKPQSKLWYHAGTWWGAFNGPNHIGIFELVDSTRTWTEVDSVGPTVIPYLKGGTNDVIWDGQSAYITRFDSVAASLYKFTYIDSTRRFSRDPGFPVAIPTGPGSETIATAKDSTGRLWAAVVVNLDVLVRYTTGADTSWAGPDTLGTFVDPDDICDILAWDGKVGVFWSNQSDDAYYFRWRNDTDPPGMWSATETVLEGINKADDHISMAADSTGRVFVGLKDRIDKIIVVRRNLDGTWDANTDVLYGRYGTRPILLIDNSTNKLYCFYTRWPTGSHIGLNPIEYRVADLNTLIFGVETTFIARSNVSMNNVQSTAQPLSPGSLVVICNGEDGNLYWNGWGPLSGLGGSGGGGQLPAPPGAPSSVASELKTAPGAGPGLASYGFDEGTGSTTADASGNGHTAILGEPGAGDSAEPLWTSGIQGAALDFNGINDYVQVPHQPALSLTSSYTVECWLKLTDTPDKMGLVNKGASLTRNYRLLLGKSGSVELSYKDASGTVWEVIDNQGIFDTNWHHVAGVYDAANSELRVYVDGFQRATAPALQPPVTGTENVLIGARQTTVIKDFFHGVIDQVRISAEALYNDNFGPPVTFSPAPTNYLRLTWSPPTEAQGGVAGYNVFRSINGSPFTRINGFLLIASPTYTDATVLDGQVDYQVTAVDLLGQEGPPSALYSTAFESFIPLAPTVPRDWSVSRQVAGSGGAVAGWTLDEGSGQDVADGAGNGVDGYLGTSPGSDSADPAWTTGISGNALHFDGSNDRVTIPDTAGTLQIPGSMTVQAWFRPAVLGQRMALLGKGTSSRRNYRIRIDTDGLIEFSFAGTDGSTRKLKTSAGLVSDTNWHHVACIYDKEIGEMRIYYDGVLAKSGSFSGTPETTSHPLYLGMRQSTSSVFKDWFEGDLDLVTISPSVLYTEDFTPPTNFTLGGSGSGGTVTLSWSIPEFGLVTGYNVYRSVDGQFDWKINLNGPITATTYTDDTPHPGQNCYWVVAVNAQGEEGDATDPVCFDFTTDEVSTDAGDVPLVRGLNLRVAPNPFNPTTRVRFHLDRPGAVAFAVYDVAGRRVRRWQEPRLAAGWHALPLPLGGRRPLGSGIYFLQVDTGYERATQRLVLVK